MAGPSAATQQSGYDPLAHLPAGYVLTRAIQDAIEAAYAANNFQPLSDGQIQAIVGAPKAFPTSLPRLPC
jgi:hypothetical protein